MPASNVIVFTLDDLRTPEDWGHFAPLVETPNLDRLMDAGTTFTRAITQVSLCNPSRASVLTGQQPMQTGILDNETPWFERVNPADTLPAVLKAAGIEVALYGKNFHGDAMPAGMEAIVADDFLQPRTKADPAKVIRDGVYHAGPFLTGRYGGPESDLVDRVTTDAALGFLDRAGSLASPFYLGVGLSLPHLDWVVPREYFALYDPAAIRAALQRSLDDGTMLPGIQEYADVPTLIGPSSDHAQIAANLDLWTDLIHGYLASVSYADARIGEVLDKLAADPALAADTSIVLWSDNGFHLGDKARWNKFTGWREATEVPVIIVDPDAQGGQRADQIVNLVDLYPTILGLMGVDAPDRLNLDGTSLLPIVRDVDIDWYDPAGGKGVALTTLYGQVSIRADIPGEGDFRYTLYPNGQVELYDITADPQEHVNRLNFRTGAGLTAADNAIAALMRGLLDDRMADSGMYISTSADLTGTARAEMFIAHNSGRMPTITGGGGDDTYVLYRNASIVESAGSGVDMVVIRSTSVETRFILPRHVEMAEVQQNFTGNAYDNWITATGRTGTLKGAGGNDFVRGAKGAFVVDGGTGNDTVTGENGADTLIGGDGNDSASGGDGSDLMSGNIGRDTLDGGTGNDTLVGGAALDRLIGGTGADTFDFNAASESSATVSDTIAGFDAAGAAAGDRIDLAGIDANVIADGNQGFIFGGSGLGRLRLTESGTSTIVLGNTDSDTALELRIVIADGDLRSAAYTAADFIL